MHARSTSVFTLFSLFLLVFLLASPAIAQDEAAEENPPDETSMQPLMEQAATMLLSIEEQGYEVVHLELDILKTTRYTYRSLYPDLEYGLLVFGDYRFQAIDLNIYQDINGKWVKVEDLKKEVDGINTLVTFKPPVYGKYRFEIIATSFQRKQNAGHAGLMIFH